MIEFKEKCTSLLKQNNVLWGHQQDDTKAWIKEKLQSESVEIIEAAVELVANALMELHPSIVEVGLKCFEPHTDKAHIGITIFFCTHGESWNFFCVEGPRGWNKGVGDYELYERWKKSLTHPEDIRHIECFETLLCQKATKHGQLSLIVVHFKVGMVIEFDGSTTVHGAVLPGSSEFLSEVLGVQRNNDYNFSHLRTFVVFTTCRMPHHSHQGRKS
jgi:hypothetical protein